LSKELDGDVVSRKETKSSGGYISSKSIQRGSHKGLMIETFGKSSIDYPGGFLGEEKRQISGNMKAKGLVSLPQILV
jgi:hypothetical protein